MHFMVNYLIFLGIWGEVGLFMDLGSKGKILLGSRGKFGEINAFFFQGLREHRPPWGAQVCKSPPPPPPKRLDKLGQHFNFQQINVLADGFILTTQQFTVRGYLRSLNSILSSCRYICEKRIRVVLFLSCDYLTNLLPRK